MPDLVVAALVSSEAPDLPVAAGSRILLVDPTDLAAIDPADHPGATHALLLGESRHEALVRRQAASLSDRGLAVAWRALPFGPGALLMIANQAVSARVDSGLTIALIDEIVARVWSGAWLRSVAKLTDPNPAVGQHLRSLAPGGTGFVVTLSGPDPAVDRVRSTPVAAETGTPRGTLYCADLDKVPAAARQHLLAVSGCTEIVDLPAIRLDTTARFGTADAVEAVALPKTELRIPRNARRCPTCATSVVATYCTFCHVSRINGTPDLQGATA